MKSYNEMANDVFRRIDRYKTEQQRKRKVLTRTITSLCCVCLVALMGIRIWQSDWFNTKPPISLNDSVIIGEKDCFGPGETENQLSGDNNNEYPDLTLLSFSEWQQDANVVWGDGAALKGNLSAGMSVELGKTLISNELKTAFRSGNVNTVYAVMVDFTPMSEKNILIEGKTTTEWNGEITALTAKGKNDEAKAIAQKINQAKENSYFEQLKRFKTKFASIGMGVYHEELGCTIDNCVFYTFATQEQIEKFACASDEAFIFTSAIRFK